MLLYLKGCADVYDYLYTLYLRINSLHIGNAWKLFFDLYSIRLATNMLPEISKTHDTQSI